MSGSLFTGVSSYEASAAFVMESLVTMVGGWWLFMVAGGCREKIHLRCCRSPSAASGKSLRIKICEYFHLVIVSGCEAATASIMVLFVTVVDGWYSTTVATESSILDVA